MVTLVLALFLTAPAVELRPIAVTVDDLPLTGPAARYSADERRALHDAMLAALKKHNIRAVGLVTWRSLEAADQALLVRWQKDGHELGNHSASHFDFNRTDGEVFFRDVDKAKAAIEALGSPVRFFRFPYLREGDTKQKLDAGRAYLARTQQKNLPVTIDNQDWSFEDRVFAARTEIDKRVVSEDYQAAMRLAVKTHERRGDRLLGRTSPQILLLHAGAAGAGEWDRLFTWLASEGHRFASIDEVLADPVFSLPHDFIGTNGPGLFDRLIDARDRELAATAVTKLLNDQAAAWNKGDVDRFCSVYADDAVFVSPSGLTRGRDAVVARYKKRYPTKDAMGTLALKVIDVRFGKGIEYTPLGDAVPSRVHAVTAAAEWTLSYPDKAQAKGMTLLVLVPRGDSFAIVQDASM
ncbi:MAG: SgcJ/EcaC family oxidoreductase [Deltaproteobacteria bacterium]|nr:SgcJ/EcaC family oxidoreductase [Deltaproteobacteria bacterium]